MTKFEEEFNYLIELSGKVLIGKADVKSFEKNRIAFFEKYEPGQPQPLPVVPEDVDKAIKYLKTENNFATFADFGDILTEKGLKWLNDFQFKDRRFGFGGLNNKLFILSYLAVTGYRVENQQLLYLKHIDMSKRNSINDLYLKKYTHADLTETGEHRLSHTMSAKGIYPPKEYCAFTQQEIDSMQTGSYELVPVEDE